jgi:transcriptional regulator with XRE-family HTH domain
VFEIDNVALEDHKHSMNPDSLYGHIGALIKSRRKQLKPPLTQEKLAHQLGISRASLANIETGRQSVLVHQLYDFAQALGISPSDFLLPAETTGASGAWNALLPDDLKPQQREQIARLLEDVRTEPSQAKEETRAKQAKR